MNENMIAKVLKYSGYTVGALGALGSLMIGADSSSVVIALGGMIGSFISGLSLVGFGEIINLLQSSYDLQKQAKLDEKENNEKKEPKSLIQDIEDNLPQM